jgi:hypothetical protein
MPKINGHPLPWNTNDDTAAMRVLLRLAVQMGPSHSEEAQSWLGSFKFRQAILEFATRIHASSSEIF